MKKCPKCGRNMLGIAGPGGSIDVCLHCDPFQSIIALMVRCDVLGQPYPEPFQRGKPESAHDVEGTDEPPFWEDEQ